MYKRKWGIFTLAIISVFAALSFFNWQKFPLFLDIYYHINAMRGFDISGGVADQAFWELAPVGNINLYPPLFHLLLLIPFKLGFDVLSIARFFSIASFLSLLAALSFVVNKLFSPKTGFFVAVAAVIPYTLFLKLTITIPVSMSLTFLLLAFYALEKQRMVACPMLIACAFYTHLGVPWMGVLAFVIYAFMKKDILKRALKAVMLSLLLAAPVIIHLLANMHRLENPLGIKVTENELFEFYPLLYLFAAAGLVRLRESRFRDRGIFFIALLLGFLPMAVNYRYRFFSGEGLLPVVFFAGLGMEGAYDRLKGFLAERNVEPRVGSFCLISLLVILNVFSPSVSSYNVSAKERKGPDVFFRDSTADNLIMPYKRHIRPFEINLADPEARKWVKLIETNTARDDIICSNYAYVGSMLSALSGRPNAAQTFYEIKRPDVPINEFGSSKLAVWLREIDGNYDTAALKIASGKYKFKLITETDKAKVLLRDGSFKAAPAKPVIGTAYALSAVFLAFLIILYDLARPRSKFSSLSKSSLE